MEPLELAQVGKGRLLHTEPSAGRGRGVELGWRLPHQGPEGAWEWGTRSWAEQSWLRKLLPTVSQSCCVITGTSLSTARPEASPGFCSICV